MPKNKKLKIKQKQRQKQNQTVIVKVDNSRKTIRKGDTPPKQPKPPQPPIIINNQQPSFHPSMYQNMFPQPQANKNITINTPPINITSPPAVPAPEPPSRSNVDDAINAFSKTNDDRFKTLQEQLNTMNDNFKQASRNIVERLNQPQSSFNSTPNQQTTPPKPDKTILINDTPLVSSTPSKGISQLKTYTSVRKTVEPLRPTSYVPGTTSKADNDINRLPETLPYSNGSTPYKSEFTTYMDNQFNELDQMLNEPFQTAKIDSNSQQNRQFTTPKVLPPLLTSSSIKQGPSSQLDSYMQQVDRKNKKQTEDDKMAENYQEQVYAMDAKVEPNQQVDDGKNPEGDSFVPTPLKYRRRLEEATGQNKEAELYNCPYCGYQSSGDFSNLKTHMRTHIIDTAKDKPLKDEDGNITTYRGKEVYYRTRGQNVTQTFDKSIIENAIENKKRLKNEMFPPLSQEEKTKRQREGKEAKRNKATNK